MILPNNPRRVRQSLSDSFRFLPEFYFSDEVIPFFSNPVINSEACLHATPNNSAVSVILLPAIGA